MFVGRIISFLCYSCLFVCRGVQHILCLLLFCYSSYCVPYGISGDNLLIVIYILLNYLCSSIILHGDLLFAMMSFNATIKD